MKKTPKTPKPTKKKRPPKKIMIIDFYDDAIEMKQKPISMAGIEALAKALVNWALSDENATKIRPFFSFRGIGGDDIKRWRGRSEHFDRAYKLAKAIIGDRREHGALTKKYAESTVLRSMHHYDEDWKSIDKWQSDLKKNEQEQKATTFNISMPSFSDKKDKENDEDAKSGDVS